MRKGVTQGGMGAPAGLTHLLKTPAFDKAVEGIRAGQQRQGSPNSCFGRTMEKPMNNVPALNSRIAAREA
jgi:hypothetical protein